MFAYEVQVILTEESKNKIDSETEKGKASNSSRNEWIAVATEHFCREDKSKVIFVSAIRSPGLILCVLSKEPVNATYPQKFLGSLEMNADSVEMREIKFDQLKRELGRARRGDFISSEKEVYTRFGLEYTGEIYLDGGLIVPLSKREILRKSRDALSKSFQAEIERIMVSGKKSSFFGHPVHYIIETDQDDFFKEASDLLCAALYHTGRLKSRQIFTADEARHIPEDLYQWYTYGSVFCDFSGVNDDDLGESYASTILNHLERATREMVNHRSLVLTVFRFPKSCEKLKRHLFEAAPDCTFVEIKEENMDFDCAQAYLNQLAKKHNVLPNEFLYRSIPENETQYTMKELKSAFWMWHDGYLKTTVYPQYAEFQNAQKQKALQKPEGDAYAKLQKMVGLESAKNVIEEAINFYKAQKLFQSYGIAEDRPSMHMVFTGNPGTAKTTVARLFAKIMRDNGILSEGGLYEVGRADLVGRYVGWTAKTVKEMFRKARGSVLFIDEAYSLVDESGTFGDEAINTIVQEMENNREDMIVIFAGYPKEMEQFLRKNPGLSSRIAFHIPFEDYSPEELYQIAELTAESKGVCLAQPVKEKLLPVFQSVSGQEDFGNGRYVRNLIERARIRQSVRLMSSNTNTATKEEIATLLPEDFEMPKPPADRSQKIGFI